MKNALIFVLAILLVWGGFKTFYMDEQVKSRYGIEKLSELAAGSNANLPTMLNENIRYDKVVAKEKSLENHYTLVNVQKWDPAER